MAPSHQHAPQTTDASIEIKARRHQNALAPISSLPPELICRILIDIVDDHVAAAEHYLTEYFINAAPFRIFAWIPLTHICAQWRDTALSHVSLWTHLWTTNLQWFKLFIERSKDQPLYLDTWSGMASRAEYDEMFQLIARNMHRIHSLHIRPRYSGKRVLSLHNIPAPHLEVLKFSRFDLEECPDRPAPVEPAIMPRLRQLHVISSSMDKWDWILPLQLPSVDTLVLEDIDPDEQMLLINRCRIGLRHLSISGPFDFDLVQPQHITLANLQSLKIAFVPWSVVDCLDFPSVSHVEVDIPISPHSPEDTELVLSKLIQLSNPFKTPEPRYPLSHIQPQPRAYLHHFSLSWEADYFSITALGPTPANNNLVLFHLHDTNRPTLFSPSEHALLLRNLIYTAETTGVGVHSISLTGRSNKPVRCTEIFRASRNHVHVSTLYLGGVNRLIELLTLCKPSCFRETKNLIKIQQKISCGCEECCEMRASCYPGLETLVLDNADDPEGDLFGGSECLDAFVSWLGERRRRGWGLNRLVVRFSCGEAAEGGLSRLREVVGSVVEELSRT
ncbi:hypothetical protein AX16_007786 [Volvariella volvacea WC 439]|nr:hypothetical protein AX16_007786 [Volvariella volvacea WC 439]